MYFSIFTNSKIEFFQDVLIFSLDNIKILSKNLENSTFLNLEILTHAILTHAIKMKIPS